MPGDEHTWWQSKRDWDSRFHGDIRRRQWPQHLPAPPPPPTQQPMHPGPTPSSPRHPAPVPEPEPCPAGDVLRLETPVASISDATLKLIIEATAGDTAATDYEAWRAAALTAAAADANTATAGDTATASHDISMEVLFADEAEPGQEAPVQGPTTVQCPAVWLSQPSDPWKQSQEPHDAQHAHPGDHHDDDHRDVQPCSNLAEASGGAPPHTPRVVPPPELPPTTENTPAATVPRLQLPQEIPVPVMGPEFVTFGNPRPVDYRNVYLLTISSISGNNWTLMSLQADGSVWAYTVTATKERYIHVDEFHCNTIHARSFIACRVSTSSDVHLLFQHVRISTSFGCFHVFTGEWSCAASPARRDVPLGYSATAFVGLCSSA
jgi:hypothetical protein